jgi:hypothetical protein
MLFANCTNEDQVPTSLLLAQASQQAQARCNALKYSATVSCQLWVCFMASRSPGQCDDYLPSSNLEPTCNVEDLQISLALSQKQGMIVVVKTTRWEVR